MPSRPRSDQGKRFEVNLDFCKGCGICVQECPSGSIVMVPEKS